MLKPSVYIPFTTAVLVLLLTSVLPAQAQPSNTIVACYHKVNGQLRRVDSPADCKPNEIAVAWNIQDLSAMTDDTLVRFRGAIGVIPVSSGVGTAPTATDVSRNIVRGVQPSGQPWVIADLRADVKVDGRIMVDGQGLLLGGGNNIGGSNNVNVFATLICEAAPTFIEHSSGPVQVDPNGDFRIDVMLTPAPPVPCASPVLLIRSAAGTMAWFVAGIPRR